MCAKVGVGELEGKLRKQHWFSSNGLEQEWSRLSQRWKKKKKLGF